MTSGGHSQNKLFGGSMTLYCQGQFLRGRVSLIELIGRQMGAIKGLSGQGWGNWIPARRQVSGEQVEYHY